MASVKIGDLDVTVEEPSIYKTELIGEKLATIGKDWPEIQLKLAQFISKYEKDNVVELDRLTALTQVPHRVQGLSESDWKAVGQKVRFSRSPTPTEQVMAILPIVFTKAKEQALDVVSLLMVPNDELEDAGRLKTTLEENKRVLRHNAKPSQLISLLSECTEVIREVLDAHKDELGKLRSFWQTVAGTQETETEHEAALKEAESTLSGIGVSASPTDSPQPTNGDSERSSTESESEMPSPSLAS